MVVYLHTGLWCSHHPPNRCCKCQLCICKPRWKRVKEIRRAAKRDRSRKEREAGILDNGPKFDFVVEEGQPNPALLRRRNANLRVEPLGDQRKSRKPHQRFNTRSSHNPSPKLPIHLTSPIQRRRPSYRLSNEYPRGNSSTSNSSTSRAHARLESRRRKQGVCTATILTSVIGFPTTFAVSTPMPPSLAPDMASALELPSYVSANSYTPRPLLVPYAWL